MSKPEFDIFHHRKVYPRADQIFVTELPSLKSIKDDCIYVLDTNALLVPFSTGSQSLDEISKIFTILKNNGKLKIPDQVAREFADNRPRKIDEMFNALSNKRNGLNEHSIGSYPLLEGIDCYNKALELEKELAALTRKYRDAIGDVVDTVKNWTWDDPVSTIYRKIFTPEVIQCLETEEEKIKSALTYRYMHKIPPGYKDDGKEDSGIGDFLIWLTILEIGKTKKHVVFVSGDVKPDWYHKSNKQALYPRFELISEFREASDKHSFHIIRLSELLTLMGAKDEVVSEVKGEEFFEIKKYSMPFYIIAEKALYEHFKTNYSNVTLYDIPRNGIDFSYTSDDGHEVGVIAMLLPNSIGEARRKVHSQLLKLAPHHFPSQVGSIDIILISKTDNFPFDRFYKPIDELKDSLDLSHIEISISIGYISENGEFREFPRQIGLF